MHINNLFKENGWSPVQESHVIISRILTEGDYAIDATAGNGNDTLFLKKCVGSDGKVFAFDIQKSALLTAENLLKKYNLFENIELINSGHQYLAENIPSIYTGNIKAVLFNLGYLPGGNKSIVTQPKTSIDGITQALTLLSINCLVSIIYYTGHSGGKTEFDEIMKYLKSLNQKNYSVTHYKASDKLINPPGLLTIEKK